MRQLFRSLVWLVVPLFMLFSPWAAEAAERSTVLLKATDLPGFDYSVIKGTKLDPCQRACENDSDCRAFTFNQKTGWCFLKGDVGPEKSFAGATSGRIKMTPSSDVIAAERTAEMPFPADDLINSARYFATELPSTDPAPANSTYKDLVSSGDAVIEDNPDAAIVYYRQALGIMGNDPAVWLKLGKLALDRADAVSGQTEGDNSYDLTEAGISSAINAFLRSEAPEDRANALSILAHGLERRELWRQAIATYRASVGLVADADVQARMDKTVAEHGFRIVSNNVDAEAATPRICVVFSDPLPTTDLANYVVVDGAPQAAIETEQTQICITGVDYGQRYHIQLRAALPSADGESLRKDVDLNVYVPDRKPFVGFANNAYVMPAGLGGGLPITSVNAKTADVVIYRIGDRSIATAVRDGIFQGGLNGSSAENIANQYGEKTWDGQVDLAQGAANVNSTTAIPVADVMKDAKPGAYVVTAKVAGEDGDYWSDIATQWFIITDLGISTIAGDDGIHAFVRSLATAEPVANAHVRLVAVNNEILGEATTDARGRADFAPGLSRGEGGKAPQLLVTETDAGDYAFLDVSKPAFDLTDRGVDGRPSPGPLDLFATTERGVYRPGETVFLTALLRDNHAKAVPNLPLTMTVERPDGVVAVKQLLNDSGAGSYDYALPLVANAMRGSWNIKLYADPNAEPLTNTNFLVEDFEPERLAFDITAPDGPIKTEEATDINVAAKYLYGATAPNLAVEADTIVRPAYSLAGYPDYTFGRLDDTAEADRESLGVVGTTDESGNVVAEVTLPAPQATTRPLEAQIIMRLVDSNGRPVERSLTRPVMATVDRIGIRPQFRDGSGLAQGSQAGFDIVTVAPTGEAIAKSGLTWTLSRVDTNYQWYRESSGWKWEPITNTREAANGTLDTVAGGPATISALVESGRYRLEVESTGPNPTSSTYEFYAGYYYPDAGSNTPDTLQVALDKKAYRAGDTAHLKLDPQFAGNAVVMVVDDHIINMVAVKVPAEGTTIDLPVTDDWAPGAYVTATLYRPASAEEKRMPSRAIGVAFADVDPGDRKLKVDLDAPDVTLPRQSFTVKVKLANAVAGQKAYVALSAVDLGILNLTNFPIPDPDGWFFGQRSLGMELRDLYGQLIDPTQGLPGALRSGGDSAAARAGTPPPTSVLVAQHSGVVAVDADGTATITFDMPDFSGTVRVTAMAWTDDAVGHSSTDVIVRDPVVVTMSPPRFLRLDDQSRLLVEINNVSGPAGAYKVALSTGEGLSTDAAETDVNLDAGARTALNLTLTGTEIGDQNLELTVTGPTGVVQTKDLTLGVRAASAPMTFSTLTPIDPGATVKFDEHFFDDLVPHSSSLTLAVGPIARLGVPELLLALDRYPYGCAEQVTSRALPLLYLNEVASMVGIGDDAALDKRIKDAIADLLGKQTTSGGFGLWSASDDTTDLWLDAYVTDFLLRAKDKGYAIQPEALTMALDNLGNQVSAAADFSDGGEGVAYALYDLSRAGRAAIGDLRYYLEARLDAFGSPLAKAQLGAALALYGDSARAATAFQAAVDGLNVKEDKRHYRDDYGSQLRDTAGVLALAAEFTPAGVDITALTKQLADRRDLARYTSTQENAWSLLAASAIAKQTSNGSVTIDGTPLTGPVYRRYDQEHFDANPVTVVNNGQQATEAKVSVTGIPAKPPAASSEGFTISRQYYLPDGTEFDPTSEAISQNDRFVVVLSVRATTLGSGQYVLDDPLPAGFEIENPDLSAGSGVADLSWLTVGTPDHVESRTDQYVAAFRYGDGTDAPTLTTAYMVRAVSPGKFVMPGATIEDMYRPDLRANTDAGQIEITPTGP
ncbi:MAG TPA: alpha-2-macroglobulin family protein [Devosiaceae bacterium]|jgi:hypothetical protein